jgi:hypothetical protein
VPPFVHRDIDADDCLPDEEVFVELKVTAVCPSDLNQTRHLEEKKSRLGEVAGTLGSGLVAGYNSSSPRSPLAVPPRSQLETSRTTPYILSCK